ncbi:MAG: hydrogen peroxide-dependent heme synthase [Actinomycetota bacterium]
MSDDLVFASYPVFRARPGGLPDDRDVAVKEVQGVLDDHAERVSIRGIYSLAGFRADADLMLWLVSNSADDLQDLIVALRKTTLGKSLDLVDQFLGLVRPAEFSPDHLPAFVQGKEPKHYVCVYPFVRTPEWYLLDPKERGALLSEHGKAGREFDDINANTTSAFGLNDWEWILTFEADSLDRLVGLIRHLRGTEARRYTKVEIPFYSGIRKELAAAVADLP